MAVNNGLPSLSVDALTASGNNLLAATDVGVFRSTDSGASWVATGLSTGTVLVLAAANSSAIFAGTMYGGVYRSIDTGTTWTAVNNGKTSTMYMSALGVNSSYVFAAGIYYPATSSYRGVYRSSNNGDSWTAINNGLPNQDVMAITASGNILCAGTWGSGVYLSTNNGDSWVAVNTGLVDTNFHALTLYDGYVFAGSSTGNIWRRPLSEIVAVRYVYNSPRPQKAINLHVDRNNMLRYTLTEAASVTIRIYDIRGRLIASPVNGRQAAGAYSAFLSASRLARGNYIIDFNAGDFRIQRLFAVM